MREGWLFQLFKLLQDLFCNMRPYVIVLENDTFSICKNRPFLLNGRKWNWWVSRSYCFHDLKKLKINYVSAISSNGQQDLNWMQSRFSHGFCRFSNLLPALFASNVYRKRDMIHWIWDFCRRTAPFLWRNSKVTEKRLSLFPSFRDSGTHVSSLETNQSHFNWLTTVVFSTKSFGTKFLHSIMFVSCLRITFSLGNHTQWILILQSNRFIQWLTEHPCLLWQVSADDCYRMQNLCQDAQRLDRIIRGRGIPTVKDHLCLSLGYKTKTEHIWQRAVCIFKTR